MVSLTLTSIKMALQQWHLNTQPFDYEIGYTVNPVQSQFGRGYLVDDSTRLLTYTLPSLVVRPCELTICPSVLHLCSC